jgi:hypothetical protein
VRLKCTDVSELKPGLVVAKQCNDGPMDTVIGRENLGGLSAQKTVHTQTG